MEKKEILKQLQALQEEQETNQLLKHIAELENQLYELDVVSMTWEVDKGYRTKQFAAQELERRRKRYFG